jgi:hypothetical protein
MRQNKMSIVLYSVLLTLSGDPRYLYTDAYNFPTLQHCAVFYEQQQEEVLNGILSSASSQYEEVLVLSEVGCGLLNKEAALEPVIVLYTKEGEAL